MMLIYGAAAGLALLFLALLLSFLWRVVVPTNRVHIVQSRKKTVSYGTNNAGGNVYYRIPAFVPLFGVTRIELPVNNFSIRLDGYEAYDKDRAPFDLDIVGFFRISDTNLAAARASSFAELEAQLKSVMQGAARSVLAKHDIEKIMSDRATFGDAFTLEVDEGLKAWGAQTVKSLELMDIRDAKGSKIIADIMAKKASLIEMESRTAVAGNKKAADIAEIQARQEVDLRNQEQLEAVGKRKAEQEKAVGIAREQASQEVAAEAKTTMDRNMDIAKVNRVREAEIAREAAVVQADERRQAAVIVAEGAKQVALLNADGVRAEGEAKGAAEQALLLAPVNAQITLAEKIASLPEYQAYLVKVREVEATERVGLANAEALTEADVRIIANTGNAPSGLTSAADVLSAKGGTNLGAMLEGLANTEAGQALLTKLGLKLS